MSRYNGYEWWEWGGLLLAITVCIIIIMGVCYAIWGPHYPAPPFDAKVQYVQSCEEKDGVPDVHTNAWTCTDRVN